MDNKYLDMALKYAEIGIPVMPLHGIEEDGSCTCKNGFNCTSKGKHPIFSGWHNIATTNPITITKWWSSYTNANIGIPTGEKSCWLVLPTEISQQADNLCKGSDPIAINLTKPINVNATSSVG